MPNTSGSNSVSFSSPATAEYCPLLVSSDGPLLPGHDMIDVRECSWTFKGSQEGMKDGEDPIKQEPLGIACDCSMGIHPVSQSNRLRLGPSFLAYLETSSAGTSAP